MNPGVRAWPWALCGGMLLATGCVIHRGPWRLDPDSVPADNGASDGVELVLVANVAPEDRAARAVAARKEPPATSNIGQTAFTDRQPPYMAIT